MKERRAEVAAKSNNLGPQIEGNKSRMPSFLHIKSQKAGGWGEERINFKSIQHKLILHKPNKPVDFKTTNSKPGPSLALDFPVTC